MGGRGLKAGLELNVLIRQRVCDKQSICDGKGPVRRFWWGLPSCLVRFGPGWTRTPTTNRPVRTRGKQIYDEGCRRLSSTLWRTLMRDITSEKYLLDYLGHFSHSRTTEQREHRELAFVTVDQCKTYQLICYVKNWIINKPFLVLGFKLITAIASILFWLSDITMDFLSRVMRQSASPRQPSRSSQ